MAAPLTPRQTIQILPASCLQAHLQSPSELPVHFPEVETPHFLYGDRVEWISDRKPTDSGIVIGRFYSFAPRCDRWCWCYLIWLDPDSPSSAWIQADVAWEDALQPAIVAREDSLERME
ncbi:MAG: hypothetical protein NW220_04250 [Leptolyngbyaceae cyanobacterium bins.349]|nr:hypothetical protein [Leptolyngbyaceae cyanobacterium bins.349]